MGRTYGKFLAYVHAALVSSLITMGFIVGIIFYRSSGISPEGWMSLLKCSAFTIILMIMGGKYFVMLGSKILHRIGLGSNLSEHSLLSLSYLTGYMSILTVIAGLNVLSGTINMENGWAFAIAYALLAFATWMSGVVFARVYAR